MPYQDALEIERKSPVPKDVRTPDKDRAAKEIDTWIDEHGWPISLTKMAEWGEYSRQHYYNVITQYYTPVEESANGVEELQNALRTVEVPKDMEESAFMVGFIEGFKRRETAQ